MDLSEKIAGERVTRIAHVRQAGFQSAFGFDVRQRQTLRAGDIRPVGKVPANCPPDVARMGILSFDPVRVVGVYLAHERVWMRSGRQAQRLRDDRARKRAQMRETLLRQQRFELMRQCILHVRPY
ncbi:MAG: hypothetical protein LBF93_06455 [Zoogloeaceae bacterium]|nr:hypothetical protein [Zoogloeaceae bacterium]